MDINRNNYEAYLLDLLEGRLSLDDQQMVRDFLVLNPDCSMHLQGSEPWMLEKEKVHFPGREQLKKEFPDASFSLTESNFDLFSIARLEGDLTRQQEMDHEAMVDKNEANNSEWRKWQLTKLVAEPETYKWKDDLKRKKGTSRRIIWLSVVSSAAAIAILVLLFRLGPVVSDTEFAVETPVHAPVAEDQANTPELDIIPSLDQVTTADEPVMFSIKKNPDRPIESIEKNDSTLQPRPHPVKPGAIRIASVVPAMADRAIEIEYDRIEPLNIPSSSVHMSSLSIPQIADIDISLWSIANAGIKGINKITGAEISLLTSRDENGDLSGFRYKSRRLSVSSPLDRSD